MGYRRKRKEGSNHGRNEKKKRPTPLSRVRDLHNKYRFIREARTGKTTMSPLYLRVYGLCDDPIPKVVAKYQMVCKGAEHVSIKRECISLNHAVSTKNQTSFNKKVVRSSV